MAGRETAGAVVVSIDGDVSPLLAKYQQAEAISRAAGQRIGNALVSPLVDASGRAQAAVTDISGALVKDLAPAAKAATVASEQTAVAVATIGKAAHSSITDVQALSGVIRVGMGEGSIRVVERFGASILGLGGAAQAVYPIIGAIAVSEIFEKVISKVTNAKEQTEELKSAMEGTARAAKTLVETLDSFNVEAMKDQFGNAGGERMQAMVLGMESMDKITEMAGLRTRIADANKRTTFDRLTGPKIDVPALQAELTTLSLQAETLAAKSDKMREHANNITAPKDAKALAEKERANLKASYDDQLSDMKSFHEVTRAEELQFRQNELNDLRSRGPAYKQLATEVNRQVGTLSQEVRKEDYEGQRALGMAQVEYASRLRKKAIADLEADGRLMDKAVEEITKAMDRAAASRKASADIADRSGKQARQYLDVTATGQGEAQRLQAEIAYGSQVVHSRQQELQYAIQLQGIQEHAVRLKLEAADADVADARAALLINPSADQLLKLQQAITEQKKAQLAVDNQQLAAQLQTQTLQRNSSLSGQIQGAVGKGPGSILDARNLVIANTMGTAVDGIASALGRAVQGGQKLGQIFTQLGRSILGQVVSQIAKIGIQMATTALLGKAVGSAIAVAEVTSAAAVGAANAAASTAAIPIVGPALAPAAAAATFAEIMAFAPLASYDKGGMIPEDMIAMVHKGEFVLTADQVSGRSAIPALPSAGGLGNSGLTTASAISNSSSQTQSNIFHLHGIRNVEEFARQLPSVLKSRAPVFSPATR